MHRRNFLKLLGKGAVASLAVAVLPKLSAAKEQDEPEELESNVERIKLKDNGVIPIERYAEMLGIHLWPQLSDRRCEFPGLNYIISTGHTDAPLFHNDDEQLIIRHRIFRENEFCHDDTVMVNFNGKAQE